MFNYAMHHNSMIFWCGYTYVHILYVTTMYVGVGVVGAYILQDSDSHNIYSLYPQYFDNLQL